MASQRNFLLVFTQYVSRIVASNHQSVYYLAQELSKVAMSSPSRLVSMLMTAILLLAGCAFPQQGTDAPDKIGGTYYVNGIDAAGREYGGQLIITPAESADEYSMEWIITGSVQTGTGTWDGHELQVTWATIDGFQPAGGTATYTLTEDGTLMGERRMDGIDGIGSEEALPVHL